MYPPEQVEKIYAEIAGYAIELAEDPASFGPSYLNELTSRCRKYTNAVSRLLMDLAREKGQIKSQFNAAESDFKIKSDQILGTDHTVKCLPNIADRTATINVMLCTERKKLDALRMELLAIEHLDTAIKHVHRELRDVAGEIKNQQRILDTEVRTKSFYGDEYNGPRRGAGAVAEPDINTKELDDAVAEALAEAEALTVPPVSGEAPSEAAEGADEEADEEAEALAFLDG